MAPAGARDIAPLARVHRVRTLEPAGRRKIEHRLREQAPQPADHVAHRHHSERPPLGVVTVSDVIRWLAGLFPEAVLNLPPGGALKRPHEMDAG